MPHYLDIIEKKHIDAALPLIDHEGIDKDSDWNEYYIEVFWDFYPTHRQRTVFTSQYFPYQFVFMEV